jgi:hypothetical protein
VRIKSSHEGGTGGAGVGATVGTGVRVGAAVAVITAENH